MPLRSGWLIMPDPSIKAQKSWILAILVRFVGVMSGGIIGLFIGHGTGIVGGLFGAIPGISVFAFGGAVWGFSAGPDLVRAVLCFRSRSRKA